MELDKSWNGYLEGDANPTYHQGKISSFEAPKGWTVVLYANPYFNIPSLRLKVLQPVVFLMRLAGGTTLLSQLG